MLMTPRNSNSGTPERAALNSESQSEGTPSIGLRTGSRIRNRTVQLTSPSQDAYPAPGSEKNRGDLPAMAHLNLAYDYTEFNYKTSRPSLETKRTPLVNVYSL